MQAQQQGNEPLRLEARGLTRTYRRGDASVAALAGVDLDVQPGAFLAITGPSGCGKTTLLHLLSGIDRPDAGAVWLDGELLTRLNETRLALVRRQRIGLIFQAFNLLGNMSALENIMLPALLAGASRREARERASALLGTLNLAEAAYRLPSELSGGQQQRVAIARALVNKPSVLFADEPTGNLDSAAGRNVMRLLTQFHAESQTIVLVTHDMQLASQAEWILVMRDGRVVDVARGRMGATARPAPLSNLSGLDIG